MRRRFIWFDSFAVPVLPSRPQNVPGKLVELQKAETMWRLWLWICRRKASQVHIQRIHSNLAGTSAESLIFRDPIRFDCVPGYGDRTFGRHHVAAHGTVSLEWTESLVTRILANGIICVGPDTMHAPVYPLPCHFHRNANHSVVSLVAVTHSLSIENNELNKILVPTDPPNRNSLSVFFLFSPFCSYKFNISTERRRQRWKHRRGYFVSKWRFVWCEIR